MAEVSPNLDALGGREILVGVSGGIAAYKAAYLVSALARAGAGVTVAMTASAKRFVTPLSFHALSGRPVYDDLWTAPEGHPAPHIALAERAEVVAVAPATADLLAKAAHGIADDLLTSTLLAVEAPLVLAPAWSGRKRAGSPTAARGPAAWPNPTRSSPPSPGPWSRRPSLRNDKCQMINVEGAAGAAVGRGSM